TVMCNGERAGSRLARATNPQLPASSTTIIDFTRVSVGLEFPFTIRRAICHSLAERCLSPSAVRRPPLTRENAARSRRIALHLLDERAQVRKPFLVAQSCDELDLQILAIQIALEVEYVRFEQKLLAVDGRSRTETCDGGCILQWSAGYT